MRTTKQRPLGHTFQIGANLSPETYAALEQLRAGLLAKRKRRKRNFTPTAPSPMPRGFVELD
jgi:hypothetical protein